ncbi:FUSC family protein [Faecalimonas sp.]
MRFYDILQLDPKVIKDLMHKSSTKNEKIKLGIGMFVRSVLIVLFAIVFISTLSTVFGSENSPMAVAMFCILLGIRFVDFGYCIRDELIALSVSFLLLLISPVLASSTFPLIGFFINVISFFVILFLTCDKPEMGNGGLFSFAYIYLSGNPVYGEALMKRFYLTLTGLVICGVIFFIKHRSKHKNISFIDIVKRAKSTDFKYQWMFRMAVGVSAILALGMAFDVERFMWAGFACGSLLSDYSQTPRLKERFTQRLIGAVTGSVLFFCVYSMLPIELHGIIGPLGGFCLGFCADYKYKTAMNCLGALMIASDLYGLKYSIFLRISNNIMGVIFAVVFYYVYERFFAMKFNVINQTTQDSNVE